MADLVLANFVKETTTTTGTGTYSLAGAATGHQGFVAGVGGGSKVPYFVTDGTNWEHGLGTVTDAATDTISRDKIYASSNSGNAVNWSAGTRDIYIAESAHRPNAVHTITGATTLGYIHKTVLCNSTSAFTVTLPPAADFEGQQYTISNISTGVVTVDANSTETIRDPKFGSAETFALRVQYDSITIVSDGAAWWVTNKNVAPHIGEVSLITATSIASATNTKLNLDTIDVAIGVSVDLAQTDELLINRAGSYMLTAQYAATLATGQSLYLRVNTTAGTEWLFSRQFVSASATAYMHIVKRIDFPAGTRLGMEIRHEGSGSLNTQTGSYGRPMFAVSEII